MVDVGVGQHHGVERAGVNGEVAVERVGLRALALEEARVEQDAGARGLQQVHGAGDLAAGGAVEGEADGHDGLA